MAHRVAFREPRFRYRLAEGAGHLEEVTHNPKTLCFHYGSSVGVEVPGPGAQASSLAAFPPNLAGALRCPCNYLIFEALIAAFRVNPPIEISVHQRAVVSRYPHL